jgi:DNA-binding CsgD family transcriptional regulator
MTPLSAREWQCAMLASQALRNDEIAERLGISMYSVRTYIGQALEKTGARNRLALAVMFARGELRGPVRGVA